MISQYVKYHRMNNICKLWNWILPNLNYIANYENMNTTILKLHIYKHIYEQLSHSCTMVILESTSCVFTNGNIYVGSLFHVNKGDPWIIFINAETIQFRWREHIRFYGLPFPMRPQARVDVIMKHNIIPKI